MFETIGDHQSELTRTYGAYLEKYRDRNCFNPSVLRTGDETLIAFRAFGENRTKPFQAFLFSSNEREASIEDLSEAMRCHGIRNVADPKLFALDDEVWMTFNTGYSKTQNQLYLVKLRPNFETPIEVSFRERQVVEKNWAFFKSKGKLKALYSINPLVVLDAKTRDSGIIHFERSYVGERVSRHTLTIGTPMIQRGNAFGFIAHRKIGLLGKRVYFGVPASLYCEEASYRVEIGAKRLIHTRGSLLGSWPKHNPNLISCTYFSGISNQGGELVLSYGINDLTCNFSSVTEDFLWQ